MFNRQKTSGEKDYRNDHHGVCHKPVYHTIGLQKDGIPPILLENMDVNTFVQQSVDPLPQALVLTSIVIGLSTLAMMVAISLRLYEKYKTFDMSEIRRLHG